MAQPVNDEQCCHHIQKYSGHYSHHSLACILHERCHIAFSMASIYCTVEWPLKDSIITLIMRDIQYKTMHVGSVYVYMCVNIQ